MPHDGEEEPGEAEMLDAVAAAAEALDAEPPNETPHNHPDDDMEHLPMLTPVPPHLAPAQDASNAADGNVEQRELDDDDDNGDLHHAMTLDALHAPLVFEEPPIDIVDNDPQTVAACIKQLQLQQRHQTRLVLAMRDTIHDLVAAQAKLQGELHALVREGSHLPTDSPKPPPVTHSKPHARNPSLLPAASKQQHHAALLFEANSLLPPVEPCDTTDEQIDEILHAKQTQHGSWPVHRLKKWIEEADLQKIRLHRTEKHAHVPIRIPRTDKNKEGRLICKLCSGGKCNRNTTWMCSTCEVPLCIDTVDGDGEQTHHVRWHRCVDLREEHLRCNALLRGRREGKKRGGEEEQMGVCVKRARLEMDHDDGAGSHQVHEHPAKMEMSQDDAGAGHHYDGHPVSHHHHHRLDDGEQHVNDHRHLDDEHPVSHHHLDGDPHGSNHHYVQHHISDHQHVDDPISNHQHVDDPINNTPHVNDDLVRDPYVHDHHGEAHANMHGEGIMDVDHHNMHVHVDL